MIFDTIVLGAGAAGLSFAALMTKKRKQVLVLEAHVIPGGSSSYFERDGYTFDAGATTLSGLKDQRPLKRLFDYLELSPTLVKIDPGIIFSFEDKSINRFADSDSFAKELKKHFPDIDCTEFLKKIDHLDQLGWSLSSEVKGVPFSKLKDLMSFFMSKPTLAISALPALMISVEKYFHLDRVTQKDFLKLVNEMLFITAQNESKHTPALMGAMGLAYPNDTYYMMGGMKAFSQTLAGACSDIRYRHKVTAIKKLVDCFEVTTTKGVFQAKKIVSTLPFWNHEALFSDLESKKFFAKADKDVAEEYWSAFMIYLTVPLKTMPGLYHQIHCNDIPHCHTNSFFVSFSHHEDQLRSQDHSRQMVTISTHTKVKAWENLSKDEYETKKSETAKFILNVLSQRLNIPTGSMNNILTGTPRTFIRYTGRHRGLVGGIPHSLKRSRFDLLVAKSPYEDFIMIGDTQFPGQGIASVVLGAMNLFEKLEGF